MTAKLINGNEIAQQIREELKQETARLKGKIQCRPGLGHHPRRRKPCLGELRDGKTEDVQGVGVLLDSG